MTYISFHPAVHRSEVRATRPAYSHKLKGSEAGPYFPPSNAGRCLQPCPIMLFYNRTIITLFAVSCTALAAALPDPDSSQTDLTRRSYARLAYRSPDPKLEVRVVISICHRID